jgi:hypothetical protein
MLNHYLAQTKDLVAAQGLAKADLLDVSAAQLNAAASKFGSKQALDTAAVEVANLRKQANVQRQEAQMRQLEIAKGKLQLGLTQAWQSQAGKEESGYIPSSATRPIFTGKPDEYLKERNERRVELPEFGGDAHTYAKSPKDREDVEGTLGSLNTIASQAQKLGQLAQQHGGAIHLPGTDARARYDSFSSSLSTELNQLQDLKRLTETEFHAFSNMIPSQKEWLTDAGKAKINNLIQMVQAKKMMTYRQKLGLKLPGMGEQRDFTSAR